MLKPRTIATATVGAACLLHVSLAFGQTALRWQLNPGEKFTIEAAQKTISDVAYSGKKTTTQIDLTMELSWEVIAADAGKMRLKQTLSRLAVRMELPSASRIEYDSAKGAMRPSGAARQIAAAVAPLFAAVLEVTMNDRGEVLEAKPASQAAEQLIAPVDDPAKPSLFSKASIQQLLRQPLAILPERPVSPDETWTTEAELNTALGKARQKTLYRYAGTEEKDGVAVEKIESAAKLELEPSEAGTSKPALKEHQQTGTIYFSSSSGRIVSAEQTQKLVTERPYRETTIVVTLTSQQRTVLKPAADR
jgi:hypothetical protein